MGLHELAAFGAALCWSVTGLIAAGAVQALGPFAFNRLRWSLVFVMLALIVLATGRWSGASAPDIWQIALSGMVGVFVGDMMLFLAMVRLGPRRTGALFALNAPIAALLGWIFLGEALPFAAVLGIALTTFGVALAVLGRPGRSGGHRFEAISGPIWIGVAFGVLAAAGQAAGSLIVRPVMAGGMDPYVASMLRIAPAAAAQIILMSFPIAMMRQKGPLTGRVLALTAASALLAMVIGMTLLLFALQGGAVGIISTISALSPVLILPVLWVVTGARPSVTSWVGAFMAIAGMALIFAR